MISMPSVSWLNLLCKHRYPDMILVQLTKLHICLTNHSWTYHSLYFISTALTTLIIFSHASLSHLLAYFYWSQFSTLPHLPKPFLLKPSLFSHSPVVIILLVVTPMLHYCVLLVTLLSTSISSKYCSDTPCTIFARNLSVSLASSLRRGHILCPIFWLSFIFILNCLTLFWSYSSEYLP